MKMTHEKAPTIDEYIETKSGEIDGTGLRRLIEFSHRVREKLGQPAAEAHPELTSGAERLLVALERANADGVGDPLPTSLREAGAAVQYLLKGADIIPDAVPQLGFVDDAAMVARVVARNPEFRAVAPS
jgi:hypothetical protein